MIKIYNFITSLILFVYTGNRWNWYQR